MNSSMPLLMPLLMPMRRADSHQRRSGRFDSGQWLNTGTRLEARYTTILLS